jgi:SAM-dependent methyltransferase
MEILDLSKQPRLGAIILSTFLREYFKKRNTTIRILEAGCGRRWAVDLRDLNYTLTGVDLCEATLKQRKNVVCDLDNAVAADLTTIGLKNDYFDIIHCSWVLEHINGADNVLRSFFDWLKPNGLLVLRIPDRDTFYGLVTRLTPFWFHTFYYKYIRRSKHGDKFGYDPCPTYYNKVVSARGVSDFCRTHSHEILIEFAAPFDYRKIRLFGPLVEILAKLVEIISLRSISSRHYNLSYIIKKL